MIKKEITLPEWAFLEANSHEGNPLEGRTVILHVRSASVIEIFDLNNKTELNYEVVKYEFSNQKTGERLIAALHYCVLIDDLDELKELLKKCATWYIDYSNWEDENIKLDNIVRWT